MSEAKQRRIGPMPAWLLFSGAAIGIVGASITKHAETIGERIVAMDGRAGTSNVTEVAPGEWGLGLLIVGAVVALSGFVVAARPPNLSATEPVTATSKSPPPATAGNHANAFIFGPASGGGEISPRPCRCDCRR